MPTTISGSTGVTFPAGGVGNTAGAAVGTTDTQTLTNKTLTTPNIDSAQFATVSGTAPLYAARAWVNFNGTGTVAINANGNVSSITDNGVGDYTVTFTTAMPDVNYSVSGMAKSSDTAGTRMAAMQLIANATATATTFVRVTVQLDNTSTRDADPVSVAVFR